MGIFAHGTTMSIGGTDIGGLNNIGLPDESKDDVEITDHDSEGDREFTPGLRDGGTIAFDGNLEVADTGYLALVTNFDADATTAAFVITLPGGAGARTYSFTGYVNALGGDAPFDDRATLTGSIKVTGAVTKGVVAS